MTRRWIFLRHGQSSANADGYVAGWVDVPLTALGEDQASTAGAALAEEPLETVLVSDLWRAQHTATLVLEAWSHTRRQAPPTPQIWPSLRERGIGEWERASISDLRADGRIDLLLSWDGRPPGGESHADLAARALPTLASLPGTGTVLVVSHGGLIRTLLGLLDGVTLSEIGRHGVANAMPHAREIAPGTWARLMQRAGLV